MTAFGYDPFAPLDIPTAAQVNGIVKQTMMQFASTSARNSALSGIEEEGMLAWTTDADTEWRYINGGWRTWSTPWTAYTPSWTNVTVGNGATTARYRYVEGDLRQMGHFTLGSTSAVTGAVSQAVAASATAINVGNSIGSCYYLDSGTANYLGICRVIDSAPTVVTLYHSVPGTGNGAVGTTAPFTWTTNDVISWDITIAALAA